MQHFFNWMGYAALNNGVVMNNVLETIWKSYLGLFSGTIPAFPRLGKGKS
jgi:hypothetical protein